MIKEIIKSLEGNYKDEYIFGLQQSLILYDEYSKLIRECDAELKKKMSLHNNYKNEDVLPTVKKKENTEK